jgi:outer membrane biosynthesis protein TonB
MEYRQGICGDCNAEYQLSPTFSADKAKCKKCGGAVAVGPVQERPDPVPTKSHTGSSAGASSAPKPKPVPTKSPKPTSSPQAAPPKKVVEVPEEAPRKRREGPTMKEKLLARRKADSEAEESTETPAPKTGKAQAARPSSGSTHPKGGKKTAGGRAGSKSSAGGSSSTRRSSTSKSSTRSGTRSKSSRRGEDDDDEGSARPGRRTRGKQKSMSPGMMIGSLVVLVVLVIAMFFVMGGDETVPEENDTQVVATGEGTQAAGSVGATSDSNTGDDPAGGAPEEDPPAEVVPDKPAEPKEPKKPEGPATETSQIPRNGITGRFNVYMLSKQPKGAAKYPDALYVPTDPAEPKLATFEPFGVPPGVQESEWIEIMDLARVMIDPDAGAAGTKAAMALEKKGKVAFPALINVMLSLDFADPEGNMAGDFCQRSLMKIANGMNVGWYHDFREEPNKTAIQNSRCVEVLYEKVWKRELREPGYFERYAKIEEMKKRDDASASEGNDDAAGDALGDALDNELDDAFDDL